MSSGMAGLYIGTSGLNAAQTALNTTAHNLANITTKGYTRQQIAYSTSTYLNVGTSSGMATYGTGVDVSEIRRVRDELIDQAYRQENGRLGYYQCQGDAVTEIESLFGEMSGTPFQTTMTNLKAALNQISENPQSTVARSALIQSATAFLDRAKSINNSLNDYQTTLNEKVSTMVGKINTLGTTICDLNKKISDIETRGEDANDLRDKRDKALDDLSGLVKIQYQEGETGIVTVTAEGVTLVSGNTAYTMGTQSIAGTNLITPVWSFLDNRPVFADTEEITTIGNNDIGELKGLLLARGVKNVDYTDVPVEPIKPNTADYDMTNPTSAAAYTAAKNKYDTDYAQYETDSKFYNTYIEPSVVLSTKVSLDKLVNGIVSAINGILCPETKASFNVLNADGTTMAYTDATVLDMKNTSYGMDTNKSVGVELFSRKNTERYNKVTATDGTTYYVKNDKNDLGLASDYTIGNIKINDTVAQNKATIPLTTAEGEEDFAKAKALVAAWTTKFAALNPSTYAKETFESFYNSMITEVADNGKIFNNMVANQATMTTGYDGQRLQTEGVSSDEELQNMIKFQQAYNASSRYINVVNEMIEHVVTRLGQ